MESRNSVGLGSWAVDVSSQWEVWWGISRDALIEAVKEEERGETLGKLGIVTADTGKWSRGKRQER